MTLAHFFNRTMLVFVRTFHIWLVSPPVSLVAKNDTNESLLWFTESYAFEYLSGTCSNMKKRYTTYIGFRLMIRFDTIHCRYLYLYWIVSSAILFFTLLIHCLSFNTFFASLVLFILLLTCSLVDVFFFYSYIIHTGCCTPCCRSRLPMNYDIRDL